MADETTVALLPVGSVVRLRDADALVAVLGFAPDTGDMQADYLGVPWPTGLSADDVALAFDASAVAEVLHRGLWDEEAEAGVAAVRRYRAAVDDVMAQMEALLETLTPERVDELRLERRFDALDDEPEPDFPDDALPTGYDDDEGEPALPADPGPVPTAQGGYA